MDVVNDRDRSRYAAILDGDIVAVAVYERPDDRYIFTHTIVAAEHEGRGIASDLARRVLDDVRAQGVLLVPQCPFIRGYIERHPEYADLVDPDPLAPIGLA